MKPENTEQRQKDRTNSLNLSFFWATDQQATPKQGMGRTLNISETGILLESNCPMANNQNIEMEIAMHNEIMSATGTVVHCTEKATDMFQTGVQFTNINDGDRDILQKFI